MTRSPALSFAAFSLSLSHFFFVRRAAAPLDGKNMNAKLSAAAAVGGVREKLALQKKKSARELFSGLGMCACAGGDCVGSGEVLCRYGAA